MRPKDAVTSTWFEGGGVSRARVKGEGNYTLWSAAAERSSQDHPHSSIWNLSSQKVSCAQVCPERNLIFWEGLQHCLNGSPSHWSNNIHTESTDPRLPTFSSGCVAMVMLSQISARKICTYSIRNKILRKEWWHTTCSAQFSKNTTRKFISPHEEDIVFSCFLAIPSSSTRQHPPHVCLTVK